MTEIGNKWKEEGRRKKSMTAGKKTWFSNIVFKTFYTSQMTEENKVKSRRLSRWDERNEEKTKRNKSRKGYSGRQDESSLSLLAQITIKCQCVRGWLKHTHKHIPANRHIYEKWSRITCRRGHSKLSWIELNWIELSGVKWSGVEWSWDVASWRWLTIMFGQQTNVMTTTI